LVVLAVAVAIPQQAVAAPSPGPSVGIEAEQPLLGDALDAAGKRYLHARAVLDESRKRQLQLLIAQTKAEARLAELTAQVGRLAAESYRGGRVSAAAVLLNSASPDSFLDRMTYLEMLNSLNDSKLQALDEAREEVATAKRRIDAEVAEQRSAAAAMARQRREAEKALALVGGTSLTGGFVSATSPVARPAPRAPGGGWADESCSENDPTTGGCVTPRMLHTFKEIKRAGFDRFVGCYRPGGPYEHPKGRACDWSLRTSGFSPAATRDQKMYGNNLTAFLVRNADRLGVLYVIWYRQIWFPATGWKSYSGPSNHTDHVHVSVV